jgi:hypothetical protein
MSPSKYPLLEGYKNNCSYDGNSFGALFLLGIKFVNIEGAVGTRSC